MCGVIFDESAEHAIELRLGAGAAFGGQRPFDHAARTAADEPPGVVVGDWGEALAREDQVERRDQVGRGIDQRAVEIENDGEHGIARKRRSRGGASL